MDIIAKLHYIVLLCVDEVWYVQYCMYVCVCVGSARNTLLIASLTPQQWPLRVSSLHANVSNTLLVLNGRRLSCTVVVLVMLHPPTTPTAMPLPILVS